MLQTVGFSTPRGRDQHVTRSTISLFALALLALTGLGCPAEQSERCRELCHDLVVCIATTGRSDVVIDEHECTSTCTALERDPEGEKRVDEYATCVSKQADCDGLLACSRVVTPDHPIDPSLLP